MAIMFKVGGDCDCMSSQVPIVLSEAQTTPLDTYYQYDIEVWDGSTWVPYTSVPGWTFDVDNLPPEMTFVPSTGTMYGTPTVEWAGFITWIVTNPCGIGYGSLYLDISDTGPPPPEFCDLTLNTSGGDAGYDHTFDVTGDFVSARDVYIDFESFTVKDQLLIYANAVLVYDSGCIGAHVTPTVSIPGGTTSARVVIVPNCAGTTGTAWVLTIECAPL